MPSQKTIQKFKRRVRADFRRKVMMVFLKTQPAFQASIRNNVVIVALAQAKQEHPNLTQKQVSRLRNRLLDTLEALVPASRPSSDAENQKGYGNE